MNYNMFSLPYHIGCKSWSMENMFFFWVLAKLELFRFLTTHIQCLGEYKIFFNGFNFRNFRNSHTFLSHIGYYVNTGPIDTLIFSEGLMVYLR